MSAAIGGKADTFRLAIPSALDTVRDSSARPAARALVYLLCGLFAALLIWALLARLDIVAVAEGRLVPKTYVKIVQPADAGIVRQILVSERQRVAKDQVLIRLDPTIAQADTTAITRELAQGKLQLRRIEAELSNSVLAKATDDDPLMFEQVQSQWLEHRQSYRDAVAQEQSARLRATREVDAAAAILDKFARALPSYEKSSNAYRDLAERKLVGQLDADARQRDYMEKLQELAAQRASVAALQAAVQQSDDRVAQLQSSYRSELNNLRMETNSRITELVQDIGKAQFRSDNLELRASQEGIVQDLATTTVGAVVQPGTVLLMLVPVSEPLRAEVQIQNRDIGFVKVGQVVRVKVAAYTFQKYGTIDGVVVNLAADAHALSDAAKQAARSTPVDASVFKAIVELESQELTSQAGNLPLLAGMQVSAEIVEGKRTVAEYLLSPVKRMTAEMARER